MSGQPGHGSSVPLVAGPHGRLFATPPAWAERGACCQVDPEIFYAPEGEKPGVRKAQREEQAKAVCRVCLVRAECLTWAVDTRERHGVWGGLTEDERDALIHTTATPHTPPHPLEPPMTHPTPTAGPAAALHLCWCGKTYLAGSSETMRHIIRYGHRPEPPKTAAPIDATGILAPAGRAGLHAQCALDGQPGGVLVAPGITAPCGCHCHRGETGNLSSSCRRNAHAKCGGTYNDEHKRRPCCCRCHARRAGA